jgi:putative chitinase
MSSTKMPKPTVADLKRFEPRAQQHYIDAILEGWPQIEAAGIAESRLRFCHFIGQSAHETGGFTIVREQCTWRAERMCEIWPKRFKMTDPIFRARYAMAKGDDAALAEMAYGYKVRPDLGNNEDGDGWNYRGGGFSQITGRDQYRRAGEAIGVDLETSPDLIENPHHSLAAYIWLWTSFKGNALADGNNLVAIGKAINCGSPHSGKKLIGEEDRKRRFYRAWAIWGAAALPSSTDVDIGSSGTEVQAVQLRLRDLGYAIGRADGAFGPETGRGIAAFKADWQREYPDRPIDPGTKVGVATRAALADASPIERPEREAMTVADLEEAGSTEVAAGKKAQKVGVGLAGVGAASGAVTNGMEEGIKESVSWLPAYQSVIAPAVDAAKWAATNALWLVPLLVGIWLVYGGHRVVLARLQAARSGRNLWR